MKKDMKKLLCERERIGSSDPSTKTGGRLDPTLDYLSGDHDWGPSWISTSKKSFRFEGKLGYRSKKLNENLNPLERFLHSSIGRPWDDVYSEIRENLCPRRAIDFHVLFHLDQMVERECYIGEDGLPWRSRQSRWGGGLVHNLYVNPDTGVLSCYREEPSPLIVRPKDSLHWHGNVWFKKEKSNAPAKCGCVHFFGRKYNSTTFDPANSETRQLAAYPNENTPCIHGNPPLKRELWYVIEYGYHASDEVYNVHVFNDPKTGERVVTKTYYRDVPEKMKEPFEVRRKSANKKELKQIRRLSS